MIKLSSIKKIFECSKKTLHNILVPQTWKSRWNECYIGNMNYWYWPKKKKTSVDWVAPGVRGRTEDRHLHMLFTASLPPLKLGWLTKRILSNIQNEGNMYDVHIFPKSEKKEFSQFILQG